MRSGQALPSVRTLADQYGVSTATVTKAIARLKESGEVRSRRGWGVFKA
jgi:DNA-binding GntR family transcriptional regulator